MTDFETQVKAAAEKAVLQFIGSGGWLLPNYESRLKVPAEWVAECWKLVDADKVRAQVAARLESELADRMVNHMAAELADRWRDECLRLRAALEVSQAATAAAISKAQFQASTNTELNALHDQVRRLKADACRRFNDEFGA